MTDLGLFNLNHNANLNRRPTTYNQKPYMTAQPYNRKTG